MNQKTIVFNDDVGQLSHTVKSKRKSRGYGVNLYEYEGITFKNKKEVIRHYYPKAISTEVNRLSVLIYNRSKNNGTSWGEAFRVEKEGFFIKKGGRGIVFQGVEYTSVSAAIKSHWGKDNSKMLNAVNANIRGLKKSSDKSRLTDGQIESLILQGRKRDNCKQKVGVVGAQKSPKKARIPVVFKDVEYESISAAIRSYWGSDDIKMVNSLNVSINRFRKISRRESLSDLEIESLILQGRKRDQIEGEILGRAYKGSVRGAIILHTSDDTEASRRYSEYVRDHGYGRDNNYSCQKKIDIIECLLDSEKHIPAPKVIKERRLPKPAIPKNPVTENGRYSEGYFKSNPHRKEVPSILYFVRLNFKNGLQYYKVGITEHSVNRRFIGVGVVVDQIVCEVESNLYSNWAAEQKILKLTQKSKITGDEVNALSWFDGKHELRKLESKNDLLFAFKDSLKSTMFSHEYFG